MYRKFVLWMLETKGFNLFVKNILPKLFWRTPKLPKNPEVEMIYDKFIKALEQRFRSAENYRGIIMSCRDPSKVTGLLIPTDIDHSAVLIGYSYALRDYAIIEAVSGGVRVISLREFIRTAEAITAHVGESWDHVYRKKVSELAASYLGRPYDRKYQFGTEELYCSEISFDADFEKRCKYNLDDFAGIGREYISPKGITEAVGMVKIFDSEIM
jgi:hypothetical protein